MAIQDSTVAYPNLKAEMARKGVKQKDIAILLDRTDDWVDSRLRGKVALPVTDALKIRKELFSEINFEYLFSDAVILPEEICEA